MAEMIEVKVKGVATHQRLVALLTQRTRYRVVNHEAVGNAKRCIRNTYWASAKALVCKVKGNVNQHVLAILAYDQQADLSACFTSAFTRFPCQPGGFHMLTGCVLALIPPFSRPQSETGRRSARLSVSMKLPLTPPAGKSVIMNTQDYLRIARPESAVFRRFQSSPTFSPLPLQGAIQTQRYVIKWRKRRRNQ